MKTLPKLTAALALAVAVSAPAIAGDGVKPAGDNRAAIQTTVGTQAQAYVPQASHAHDPAAYAGDY